MKAPRLRMRTLLLLIALAAVPLAIIMLRMRPGDPVSRRREVDSEAIVIIDPPTGLLALHFMPGDTRGLDGRPAVDLRHGLRVVAISDTGPRP